MNTGSEAARYLQACENPFWRQVFAAELDYLLRHLRPGDEVLSVGCGPAIIESGLAEHGFSVIGLDVSQEAIACAPDTLRTIVAPAEKMPFDDAVFDVVMFIVSLQFVENYRQALYEARRVLRPGGRIIAMLLNPDSNFFQAKSAQADSYVRKMRHCNLAELEAVINEGFEVRGDYFLGITDERVFSSHDPRTAALCVIQGNKRRESKE
ncbi:MAG: class I SAM-dependent methyltransferase [Desulfuromonadales bacterium]|nr:class I SAM-dependent methyltransferase [Desulfuromonadales bacterium]MBN2791042.1 class I SAM-dependent methyltransferase [Desulfuromonadales bacterium]